MLHSFPGLRNGLCIWFLCHQPALSPGAPEPPSTLAVSCEHGGLLSCILCVHVCQCCLGNLKRNRGQFLYVECIPLCGCMLHYPVARVHSYAACAGIYQKIHNTHEIVQVGLALSVCTLFHFAYDYLPVPGSRPFDGVMWWISSIRPIEISRLI